jgi:cob(I)alamin adenosyltransferase
LTAARSPGGPDLARIYTRTGDNGTTGLISGPRRKKSDQRLAAIGDVDEVNAAIGLARVATERSYPMVDARLARVQADLFALGAELATPEPTPHRTASLGEAEIAAIEADIDTLDAELTPLATFVLPGGTRAAASLHLARAICRRAERTVSTLVDDPDERLDGTALRYLNRLADFLFVAARYANGRGKGDVPWAPAER